MGTVTEIYDYLRILFARLGHPYCPKCGVPIGTQTADEIVEKVLHLPEGTKVYVMAPFERRDGERYESLWDELRASGFARVRVDGQSVSLDEPPKLSHRRKHKIEVVVDRAIVRRSTRSRLADSIESALDLGKGVVHIARVGDRCQRAELARRSLQPAPRLRFVRPQLRRAGTSSLLVQQPAGLVPDLPGVGHPARCQPGGACARWPDEPSPGSRRRLAGLQHEPDVCPDDRGARPGREDRSGHSV